MRFDNKKIALMGISVSLAMVLSYIEFLLPPIFNSIPGIKMGLANVIIIYMLFTCGAKSAFSVSLIRVALSSLLFGESFAVTLAYSLAGALLSLTVMTILKKTDMFSEIAVSITGAVSHNLGQILVAIALLRTAEIGYYMIVLTVTGVFSGLFVGYLGALLIKRIKI